MTNSPSITATDYGHLKVLIQTEIANYGPNCDLNHIDVSNITSMMGLFQDSEFNGSIADWNVSKVTNMESIFNGDISRWNVERLRYASGMFEDSKFNGDVRSWRPVALMEAHGMFAQSMFRGDLSQWPLPPACDTKYMLSPEMLSEMTAPCLYHWRLLLEGKMPMDLPSTWMNCFDEAAPFVQALDLKSASAQRVIHERWLEKQRPASTLCLELPELDAGL